MREFGHIVPVQGLRTDARAQTGMYHLRNLLPAGEPGQPPTRWETEEAMTFLEISGTWPLPQVIKAQNYTFVFTDAVE